MLFGAPPPSVFFGGRLGPPAELSAMSAGWLEALHAAIPPQAELTALPLANHPETIALFFALSSLPLPVVVLPADPRAWRTSPSLTPATPMFLPPSLAPLAAAGDGAGLRTIVLPEPRPPAGPTPSVPFLTTPGIVNFTSGSTGLPKPVYIRTRSFELQTAAIVSACRLDQGAAVAGSLPLAMHYGLGQALLLPAFLRSTLGLVERFEPRSFLRLLEAHPCAYWAGTPLMAEMLARSPWSGPRPTVPPICHISAGRLSARVFEDFRARFGVTLRPNYGQTENGFITVDTGPEDDVRPGAVGRPAPGIEVRIGDDPRDPLPTGRLGRVWFRSPWYMDGYGFPPRLATREELDGWWPTQDLGSLDETSRLTLAGRADDCFKTSGGYLVNPGEIAEALMSHPDVADLVVLPVPSPLGVLIGALVESAHALDPDEVRVAAARTLPPWLSPQVVGVTPRLPRLAGGKPDRSACLVALRGLGGGRPPSCSPPGA
jgi:acyl-CoA synthetase (AMP-forming)/AMP-acid ligase II